MGLALSDVPAKLEVANTELLRTSFVNVLLVQKLLLPAKELWQGIDHHRSSPLCGHQKNFTGGCVSVGSKERVPFDDMLINCYTYIVQISPGVVWVNSRDDSISSGGKQPCQCKVLLV